MNIAFYNVHENLNKDNFMFENKNASLGDDLLSPLLALKKYANMIGINIATVDVMDLNQVDALVFLDMPNLTNKYFKYALESKKRIFLILCECEIINKKDYNRNNHKYFMKIFTHNDLLVDNKKYFKLNISQDILHFIPKNFSQKEKLTTLIASNKTSNHPLELYSKRVEAIRWFEKYHPEDFDLYGIGWDEYTFRGPRVIRVLNRIKLLKKIIAPYYPSYKGQINRKKNVLEKYKFSICYENARDIPGYITEKIFDCFFAGCVPIYWGASNIVDHIPESCFIDKRKFKTYEALYDFIINMNDNNYMNYLENIETFLKSDKAYPFSSEYFAETIIREIVKK